MRKSADLVVSGEIGRSRLSCVAFVNHTFWGVSILRTDSNLGQCRLDYNECVLEGKLGAMPAPRARLHRPHHVSNHLKKNIILMCHVSCDGPGAIWINELQSSSLQVTYIWHVCSFRRKPTKDKVITAGLIMINSSARFGSLHNIDLTLSPLHFGPRCLMLTSEPAFYVNNWVPF